MTEGRTGTAVRGINRASILIATLTLGVKLLALVRDGALAAAFGTSESMEVFLLGTTVVTFVINVFLSSFHAAYVPGYVQLRQARGRVETGRLVFRTALQLTGAMLVLTLILASHPEWVLRIFAPRVLETNIDLARRLFRALVPLLVVGGVSTVFASTLNAEKRFTLPALAPALTPLAIVPCLILASGRWGVYAAVWGMWIGAALELALLAAALRASGIKLSWEVDSPTRIALRTIRAQYAPVLLGTSLASSTTLIDFAMVSRLEAGSIAALGYASRLPSGVVTLTSGALSTAVLPYFSKMVAAQDWRELEKTTRHYLVRIVAVTIPIALLLALGARPLVRLFFEHGAFTPADTERVAAIQVMYAIQIPFYVLGVFHVRIVSAFQRNDLLLYVAVLNATLNFGLDWLLMRWLGAPGIALSTSLVLLASSVYLTIAARVLLKRARRAADSAVMDAEERRPSA